MYFPELSNDMIIKSPLLNPYNTAKLHSIKFKLNANIVSAAGDKKLLLPILSGLISLSGQRPLPNKARDSVAAFKVRKFTEVGAELTLRGKKLHNFIKKFRIFLPFILFGDSHTRDLFLGNPALSLIKHYRIGIRDLAKISGVSKGQLGGSNVQFCFKGDNHGYGKLGHIGTGALYLSRLGVPA